MWVDMERTGHDVPAAKGLVFANLVMQKSNERPYLYDALAVSAVYSTSI